jgi:schlafen family protein
VDATTDVSIGLGQCNWEEACDVVAWSMAPVAWSWAALRDQQGQWELAVLTVCSGTTVPRETSEYERVLIRTETVPARVAADRLRARTTGSVKPLPDGLEFQPEGVVQPVWVTTEPSEHKVWVMTDWPGWYLNMGIAGGHLAGFNDLWHPADGPRQRSYFPSGFAALASRVYGTPPFWQGTQQQRHVVIWLPDRRIRLGDVRFEKGEVLVGYEVGARLGDRIRAKAAWRLHRSHAAFLHDEVRPEADGGCFAFKTGDLPVEFSVHLSDDGRLLDRRSWSETMGRPPLDESSLEAQMAVWLLEGEGVQLEYKESLGKEHNREFAETVAAFANSCGGVILLGVADDATVVGYDPPKVKDTIASIIRANVSEYVEPAVTRVIFDGNPVHVILVAVGDRPPYQSNGRVMIRAGATDRSATPDEIRALAAKASGSAAAGRRLR